MSNAFCLIAVFLAPSTATILIARTLVQEKDGKLPLFKNIFWTFGLVCLVWGVISIVVLRWQLNCVDPPDSMESGCGMAWSCFTLPIIFTTGIVFLYSLGYVIGHLTLQRREHDKIDWRGEKSREFDLHDLLDE